MVRLTNCPDMIIVVYRGRKKQIKAFCKLLKACLVQSYALRDLLTNINSEFIRSWGQRNLERL